MAEPSEHAERVSPAFRVFCFVCALLLIYGGISLKLDHPMQLTMDFLAPIPLFLLAATNSYKSDMAKLALFFSILLWVSMIAAPFVFPSPLRF